MGTVKERTVFNSWFNMFASLLGTRASSRQSHRVERFDSKVHDFSKYQAGVDYFFDLVPETSSGYLTSSGTKVQPGDLLRLSNRGEIGCYIVEEVDCYCNTPGMWIACVKKV
ncbi:MAG: hypothetical protein AAGB13_18885 [Cyanobacteria bacterium P01_F01_bin.33]